MKLYDFIGAGMKAARVRRGWSMEEGAAAFRRWGLANWHMNNLWEAETGRRRPRLDELLLICGALGVTLDELIAGDGEPVELGPLVTATPALLRARLHHLAPDCGALAFREAAGEDDNPPGPTEAERHAARRLGISAEEVIIRSNDLWGRDFDAERDSRVGDVNGTPRRSLQARRGLVTRGMLTEIAAAPSPRNRA